MNPKIIRKLLIASVTIAACIALWPRITDLVSVFSDKQALINMLRNSGGWGWIFLIILLVLRAFLAFIPGQGLMIASGYIYGFWQGLLLTWFGLTLGGQISFWLARRYGRPFASRFVSQKVLSHWDGIAARQGMGFYIVTLFIPIFPNDAMCFVAGLGDISFRRFLVANMLGRFVATSAMTFVGAYGTQIPVAIWAVLIVVLAILMIAWRFLKDSLLFQNIKMEV